MSAWSGFNNVWQAYVISMYYHKEVATGKAVLCMSLLKDGIKKG